MEISGIVDVDNYPISDLDFQRHCRTTMDRQGVVFTGPVHSRCCLRRNTC